MTTRWRRIFRRADDIVNRMASAGTYIGGFMLFLMMLLISADAIGRYVFHNTIKGSLELIEILLVVVVFFSIGQVAVKKAHVSVTLVFSRFPLILQAVLSIFTSLLSLGISFLMARQFAVRGWTQLSYTTSYSQSLEIPLRPVYLAASLGLLLLSMVLLIDFIRCLMDMKNLETDT